MKSKLKNSSLFLITKQLYRTFRQSMYCFLKKGDFKRAYYWFTVRNVVSLFGSKAGSNKKESYHLSAELYSEGFMELNRLTKKTVNDLTNLFLTSQEEDYKNLSDYFQNQRKKNFVRSAALNVAKNNEICLNRINN